MIKQYVRLAFLATLFFLLAICLMPLKAEASVYIERAIPKPETTIEEVPEELRIQFSQKIIAPLSRVQIRDYTGQVIRLQHLGVDKELIVPLPSLEAGHYYVEWRVLGRDGAVTEGSYRFALNVELTMDATSSLLLEGSNSRAEAGVGGLGIVNLERFTHLVNLVCLVLLASWIIFHRFLWNSEGQQYITLNERHVLRCGKSIFWLTGLLFFITGFIYIGVRLLLLYDGGEFWQALMLILTSTSLGWITLARPLLVIILYMLFHSNKQRSMWLVVVLLALIATFSLGSQGFFTNTIVSHTIHLAAFIVWLAGLAGFGFYTLFLKRQEQASPIYIVKRLQVFYNLGLVLLFFILISGFLLSSVYVGSWTNLIESSYGQTLCWKLILLLPLLALVVWHRFYWIPNLSIEDNAKILHQGESNENDGFQSLLLGIRLELGLVILIFFISGILSTLIPPGDPHQGHQHNDLFVHLDVFEGKEDVSTTLLAYVLWERKRLSGAAVTFEIWDKEHDNLLTDAEAYCRVNNMSLDFFRQSLIEQGFIYEVSAQELESVIYSGQIDLTQGSWQVGVNVKHHEPDIEAYTKFILSIN